MKLTAEQNARLARYAKKAMATSLPFLTFKDRNFLLGGMPVSDSDEWVAQIDEACAGWIRFNSNYSQVVETHSVRLLDEDAPPRPNSHTDRDKWPYSTYGTKRNPWTFEWQLPMQRRNSGELAILKSSSEALKNAIGRAIEDFRVAGLRPVVRLLVRETIGKSGATIATPDLEIIDHDDGDDQLVNLAKDDPVKDTAAPKQRSDIDDDIPF
jgi:hypothetical protein